MKLIAPLVALLMSSSVYAQEEVPSFETVVEDVIFNTSSRIVLDEKAIKDSQAPNIVSLISTQANISVTNTPFQPNSIYIRGGDSSHVLILVDGVPFYDASTIQRTINLNSLDIRSVRRIEIIKGSQTVLYGGQALSGVIKIETIPQDFVSATGLKGDVGTYNTKDISVIHSEPLDESNMVIFRGHGGWKDMRSPVLGSPKTYERNNWSGEGTYAWKGAVEGHIKANYTQDWNLSPMTNYATNALADVDGFEQYARQLAASSVIRFHEVPWSPRLSLGVQNSYRELDQPVSSLNPTVADEDYGANLRTVRLDFTPIRKDSITLNAGLSYLYEDFMNRSKSIEVANKLSEQRGAFAKADIRVHENAELSVGGRVEAWDSEQDVSTYQAGVTLFKNTKLEVSSGYKIPSLFQRYAKNYGNPNLKDEKAMLYSLTQDFDITANQKFSATAFYSEFSDLIVYMYAPGGGSYLNVNKAEAKGLELSYSLRPTETSSLFVNYGYQEPKDKTTNRWLLRRPLVSGSVKYSQYWGKSTTSFEVQGTGERLDMGPRVGASSQIISLPGFAIANAAYTYDFTQAFKTYARINNLLDYRYQETYSYYTEGISAQLGAEYWF